MSLKADLWFPSIVFAGYVESIDRDSLKQIALAWQAKEPNLGGNSNMNGWHSRSIENINLVDPNYVFALNTFVKEETEGRVRVKQVEFREHGKNSAIYAE